MTGQIWTLRDDSASCKSKMASITKNKTLRLSQCVNQVRKQDNHGNSPAILSGGSVMCTSGLVLTVLEL